MWIGLAQTRITRSWACLHARGGISVIMINVCVCWILVWVVFLSLPLSEGLRRSETQWGNASPRPANHHSEGTSFWTVAYASTTLLLPLLKLLRAFKSLPCTSYRMKASQNLFLFTLLYASHESINEFCTVLSLFLLREVSFFSHHHLLSGYILHQISVCYPLW